MRKSHASIFAISALMALTAGAQSVSPTTPTDTINVKVLSPGNSLKTPGHNSRVQVHYEGSLLNGQVFDSSYSRGKPITFSLLQVIPCWGQGLQSVTEGSTVELTCPAHTAYGARELPNIPANSVLKFKIELLQVL